MLSDVKGLRPSSPSRKSIAQPPPLNVLPPAQKKSMIKAVDGSPNYMKSTSSSKAKKTNFVTGSNSKNLPRRCSTGSKTSSGSCNNPASFNLLRTLRKAPNFKKAKKCSKVALSADMNNVHGATCSSTLKDSNFPPYLMLNHGTESEGTSVFKVCTYTYCSLNGHHRTPVPPLKCFLKAKRRSMKTQRSMKMEALSPRRRKPPGDGTVHTSNGVDSDILFIVIDAKNERNDAEATQRSTQMNGKGMDDSECIDETTVEHDIDTLVWESLSEGSPHSEFDFDEHFEHLDEIISKVDDDFTKTLHEEPKNLAERDEKEGVSSVDVDMDSSMFDVIDLEWEEWQFSASEPDYESRSSMESDQDQDQDQDEAKFSFTRNNAEEELPDDNHNNREWTVGYKRHEENCEEEKKFNPREPNFLPVVPEPDAEKVDLRHQMMDERKNAEDWMIDHALRQAVTKLAPARKRKVALLVEAFETVLPIT